MDAALDFSIEMSQVSLFILPKMVVSVQEEEDPVLRGGMHRRLDTSYAKGEPQICDSSRRKSYRDQEI